MNQQADLLYRAAYAQFAGPMRSKWQRTISRFNLNYARGDILQCLDAFAGDEHAAYRGKLMAELDAIRDREMTLTQPSRRTQ